MIYEIDLAGVTTPYGFHKQVRKVLPVPEWYGKNLDALHDILTEHSDWTVRFYHMEELRKERPGYVRSIERMCRESGAEILWNISGE